jgi:hypothetical protein
VEIEIDEPGALWREDSAVWEIIAGELVLQRNSPMSSSSRLLLEEGRVRAAEAARLAGAGDLDNAGHAMIGCSLALALAGRAERPGAPPVEQFAADFAADIAWAAREPNAEELDRLAEAIGGFVDAEQPEAARGIGDLAVRAGSYAAGFSPHITRRRQRRDLVDPPPLGTA